MFFFVGWLYSRIVNIYGLPLFDIKRARRPTGVETMTGDQFTQLALEGTRVEIYWNTRDLKWSVRSLPSGRVIGHVSTIDLDDCSFVVQPAGRERVRREKRKNVHAFVRGTVAPLQGRNHDRSLDVTYNPYLDENFRVISTYEPIH